MKTVLMVLPLLFSFAAFAGEEPADIAVPASCAGANWTCSSARTLVCVFDRDDSARVIELSSGEVHQFEGVRHQPIPPGIVGAPQVYLGEGFDLHVISDALEQPGYLTVPSLGLDNETLRCRD